MGQNVNGVWRYILNTDDEPVQQFGAKVCRYNKRILPIISH